MDEKDIKLDADVVSAKNETEKLPEDIEKKVEETSSDIKDVVEKASEKAPENKNESDDEKPVKKVVKKAAKAGEGDSNRPKEKVGEKIGKSYTSRKFKGGAYSVVLSVIAIVVVIVVNLIFTKLDINIDLTDNHKYDIHQETKDLLANVTDDITIYYLIQSANENDTQTEYFSRFFKQYPKENANVKVEYKDPVLYPGFAKEKGIADEVMEHSFIVENKTNGKTKYVGYRDIVQTELDYTTYQSTVTGFDIEGQLDSAILYCTTQTLPVALNVTGHGEQTLGSSQTSLLERSNISVVDTKLITYSSYTQLLDACNFMIINQPSSDFTDEEIQLLKDYMTNGGRLLINTGIDSETLTNFRKFLEYYSVGLVDGIVFEGDSNFCLYNRPFMLIPSMYLSDITTNIRNKKLVIAPYVAGLTVLSEKRDEVSVTKLLYTSDTSYSKALTAEVFQKEDGDPIGKFYVGVQVEETNTDNTGKMLVYSSGYQGNSIFNDAYMADTYGNVDLFSNSIDYLVDGVAKTVSVEAFSAAEDVLSFTQAKASRLALIMIFAVPLAFIVIGILVVVMRKRKQ